MRLMRKQNGMIVPMKVSRWSISVWITDLKNSIGFLFLLLTLPLVEIQNREIHCLHTSYALYHKIEKLKGEIGNQYYFLGP